jgi:cytokinin dehydrogenase
VTSLEVPDGTVHTDERVLSAYATDFGGVVSLGPMAVVRAGSVEDVVATVRWAVANGLPFVPRGTGHAMNGQAQVDGGIVLDLTSLSAVLAVEDDRAVVAAGTRWSTLLAATLPLGLAPPVVTDYPHTTVGGTLSTGGLSGMSHRHGAQTDNVVELDVVTPDGEVVTCSAARERALFDAVRAGLGRHGVIVRATVALVPAPERVRCHRLGYSDMRRFTADLRRLVDQRRFDHVVGFAKRTETGQRYEIEVARPPSSSPVDGLGEVRDVVDVAYGLFLDRVAPSVAARRAAGDWARPHPWLNVLLPDSAADDLLERVMAELTPADLGDFGVVLFYPMPTAALATPLLRVPEERLTFLLALLLTATTDEDLARITERNERLYAEVRRAGGVLYPVGPPDVTGSQ